ncbi:glycoside hydrolase family 99-like domain-containing protein, partial [Stutzerimonas kunmingensis]|uniref:glycoside hydrolase family 99-like domain-containing protein n=1 Tax=Stutzerimonas kunmingensis TaxID=1211807 RepID=UPI002899130B
MEQKRIVVVLGMHRSGTSAITRGLQVLGVDLSNRLLQAETGNNEKGFWEDIDITAFDVDLLAEMGHDWHTLAPLTPQEFERPEVEALKLRAVQLLRDKLADTTIFGLKDPRMCRLMPFWVDVFAHLKLDVSFVIACRNPMSVAHSLARRNGFALEKSYLLWLEHMLLSIKHTANGRRVFVDYDQLLGEPLVQLERISTSLGLPFSTQSQDSIEYQHEFLERSLRHTAFGPEDLRLDAAVTADAQQLHELLCELTDGRREDGDEVVARIEALYTAMMGRYPAYRLLYSLEDKGRNLALRLDEAETISANLAAQANEARAALSAAQQEATALAGQLTELSRKSEAEIMRLAEEKDEQQSQVYRLKQSLSEQADELQRVQHSSYAEIQRLDSSLSDKLENIQRLEHALNVSRSGRVALKHLIRALANRAGLAELRNKHLRRQLMQSGLFDASYYRQAYPDVVEAGMDPFDHFVEFGWKEGRNPAASFSVNGYLERYPDVRLLDINPLVHYLRHGYREGRMVPTVAGGSARPVPRRTAAEKGVRLARLLMDEPRLAGKFVVEARRGGVRHAIGLVRSKTHQPVAPASDYTVSGGLVPSSSEEYNLYKVVPYYLNPYQQDDISLPTLSVGIHLHLFYEDMADECLEYLGNIPLSFDLYISIPEHQASHDWESTFKSKLPQVRQVVVERVPNRGRDLAPLVIQFGKTLADYDVIAHFHTKKSPHRESLEGWFGEIMSSLCGSRSGVSQILNLFGGDAKVVYPAGDHVAHWDSSGWSDNQDIAKALLRRHTKLDMADFDKTEFPQGSMFWGKGAALREFLSLPLDYNDFAEEPIAADATLAHALERLILVFSTLHEGRNYRIESQALSREPQQYYEDQHDFSAELVHDSIKVLAYYLPQFHPTPENDAWHGKGFTEWHKVAAANPLFEGHYQQHIPHPDLGYYHLDSPQQLALQADMMRQAGVNGLIFYHYWFSGKLILEKPAQMLLDNPDIDMPFSFCWANENWTRRWDGNEKEILLGQVYSPEDALAFIRYMVPFFKDRRYIKVEGRPVLFVYRPSAMEHVEDYLRIWREECERNDVPAPYVVATLTRGAVSPAHYGMDAAVERVLHDWTGGAVADIRHELNPYGPINGSVLDYSEVADHYMHKQLDNDYVLFRSLVPTWDNTARYGTEAILLHRFTTGKFQEWLEHLIQYSVKELPADRRFVVVNAWNEWAEGAHLEPDTRFGYGYLNSIGRALSNYGFNDTHYLEPQLRSDMLVRIDLADEVGRQLAEDGEARRKFIHCLASSALFQRCGVATSDASLAAALGEKGIRCIDEAQAPAAYTLRFNQLYLFPATCIESLLLMALRHPGFAVSPSVLNDPAFLHDPTSTNFDVGFWKRAGMEVAKDFNNLKGYKVACKAACFRLLPGEAASGEVLPTVSTVMRFHRNASLDLIANAMLSLVTQVDCKVRLHLAVQDLDEDDLIRLDEALSRVPWAAGCEPIVRPYYSSESNPDLRSLMLNESLKAV